MSKPDELNGQIRFLETLLEKFQLEKEGQLAEKRRQADECFKYHVGEIYYDEKGVVSNGSPRIYVLLSCDYEKEYELMLWRAASMSYNTCYRYFPGSQVRLIWPEEIEKLRRLGNLAEILVNTGEL